MAGIQTVLDDTFGEAWDFSLDPIALQVSSIAQEGVCTVHNPILAYAWVLLLVCLVLHHNVVLLVALITLCTGWTL